MTSSQLGQTHFKPLLNLHSTHQKCTGVIKMEN